MLNAELRPALFGVSSLEEGGYLLLTMKEVRLATPDGRPLIYLPEVHFTTGITALAGPNGSGKSTLLRAIATLHPISDGAIVLDGIDASKNRRAFLESLIYLPQNFTTYPDLTGEEFLAYSLRLRGADKQMARSVAHAWIGRVGLQHAAKMRTGAYSQGMRQRLGFAYAMQVDVPLYVMDEPFSGVDPESREIMLDLLFSMDQQCIVIVSTHHVEEFVNRGAMVARVAAGNLAM